MSKKIIPLMNNAYIISLIGEAKTILKAEKQIGQIASSWGLTVEFANIVPRCLALNPTNKPCEWRVQLQNLLVKSESNIIINTIGFVDSDSITDFSRSVRAFSVRSFVNRHPWNFIVDPNVTNKNQLESKLLEIYKNSGQVNVYAGADTLENNKKNLETFIKPMELI